MNYSAPLFLILVAILLVLPGCFEEAATPKPKAYFRINLPEHEYSIWEPENCPYQFEVADDVLIDASTGDRSEPCWFDITYPNLRATIYLSYKPVNGNLNDYLDDARTMTQRHMSKASAIDERVIHRDEDNVHGILFEVEGTGTASAYQFFATDSNNHFLRGALYFMARPNSDSLRPVVTHLEKDIEKIMTTLKWR
jgi:gliding motility-associated lipoprotein GldD